MRFRQRCAAPQHLHFVEKATILCGAAEKSAASQKGEL
jgi:hypothetical protein